MTIKRILSISAAAAIAAQASWAFDMRADSTTINLSDINVAVNEATRRLSIDIDLDLARFNLSRDREMTLTPVLMAAGRTDSLELETITVAGRNLWYHYLRNNFLEGGDAPIFRAGKPGKAHYSRTVDLEPWMERSTVEMRVSTANCCDKPLPMPGPSDNGMVPLAAIDVARPPLDIPFVFAPPVDAGPVTKSIEGSAFVTFVVNRTELKENYMNNRHELDKIINSIEYVRRDPDATITHVHIKGFASPEGPYNNNVRLAMGRTETLRRYVRDLYSFPDTTVTSDYEPEDWAGLRKYITDSMQFDISHRPEILAIIDGPLAPDPRNSAIQTRYPEDYAIILKDIYPWLRHSDYKVKYVIKTYTTLEEIKRVYASDPTRLRNVDFYTLAQSYPEGSPEYCAVFEKAVEVYPDDPMLNLNAANIEMQRGEYDKAQSHLLKSGHGTLTDYARAILAAKRGDVNGALVLLQKVREEGMTGKEIDTAIANAEAIRDYHPVTYFILRNK